MRKRRSIAVSLTMGLTLKGLNPVAAGAHSWNNCPSNYAPTLRGPGYISPSAPSGDPNVTYRLSPNTVLGVNDTARDQSRWALNTWGNQTDLNVTEITTTGWDVYVTSYADPDQGNAGVTEPVIDNTPDYPPGGTNPSFFWCRFEHATVRWNTTHVNNAGNWAGNDKGCIIAHEAGHALGLGHSNIANHNDTGPPPGHTAGDSVMRGGEHPNRCHAATPPFGPRAGDISDVNAKY